MVTPKVRNNNNAEIVNNESGKPDENRKWTNANPYSNESLKLHQTLCVLTFRIALPDNQN